LLWLGRYRQPTSVSDIGKRKQAELKMTKLKRVLCWPCRYSLLTIIAFGVGAADTAFGQEKPAEPTVKALNHAVLSTLPFNNQDDFKDAARGFIATLPDALVTGPDGHVVWSQKDYAFLEKQRPTRSTPASGGRRSSTISTGCSRSSTEFIKFGASTFPT
jgi:hypothetical protein